MNPGSLLPGLGSAGVIGALGYQQINEIKEDIDMLATQFEKIDPEIDKIESNRQSIDQIYQMVLKHQEINTRLFDRLQNQHRVLIDLFYTLRDIQNALIRVSKTKTRPLGKESLGILFKERKEDLKTVPTQSNPSSSDRDVVDELDNL